MDTKLIEQIILLQRNEITESLVYARLAEIEKNPENKLVLKQISNDESRHYDTLKKYTHQSPAPKKGKILFYYLIARIFGVTFGIKLMENGEGKAQNKYATYENIPDIQQIAKEEDAHEQALIEMIKEERLDYMGSIVLGLNDALVEFTGALAGFTLALHNSALVALTGSITGIAAALSMASSEYLSTRVENQSESKRAIKASIYTGIAYIITVAILILPFVLFQNIFIALALTIIAAVVIIAIFNYYYSVVKNENFRHRFFEMAILSLSVAAISFIIGYLLKEFTGIDTN